MVYQGISYHDKRSRTLPQYRMLEHRTCPQRHHNVILEFVVIIYRLVSDHNVPICMTFILSIIHATEGMPVTPMTLVFSTYG